MCVEHYDPLQNRTRGLFRQPIGLSALFLWLMTSLLSAPLATEAAPFQLNLSGVPIVPPEQVQFDSVGLMFCLDISGSMGETVGGRRKIDISKAAMRQVFAQVAAYLRASQEKTVKVGLCSFSARATLLHPLGRFDENQLTQAMRDLQPASATAIGDAMTLALRELLKAGVASKAIIVMTDGENTAGVPPDQVMRAMRRNENTQGALTDDVKVFLVAFDVKAKVFETLKSAGASVMESRDRVSLEGILKAVVEEVLLEQSR